MELKKNHCQSCGASLNITKNEGIVKCEHCGTTYQINYESGDIALESMGKLNQTIQDSTEKTNQEIRNLRLSQEIATLTLQLSNVQAEIRSLESKRKNRKIKKEIGNLKRKEQTFKGKITNLENQMGVNNQKEEKEDKVRLVDRFKNLPKTRKILLLIVLVLFILLCCLVSVFSDDEATQSVEQDESQLKTQIAATLFIEYSNTPDTENKGVEEIAPTDPVPVSIEDEIDYIKPGTYLVGSEIQPGIYKGIAGTDFFSSCYWERVSSLSGDLDSILANDNGQGQFYIEVLDSDYAISTNCEISLVEITNEMPAEFPSSISPGTYIVGRDIQSGMWKGQAGEDSLNSCYWARVKDLTGNLSSIIANDNAVGQYYIQVAESDFALVTNCDLIKSD